MNQNSASTPSTAQRIVLWAAMLAALAASWAHVASAFAGLEQGGAPAWITRLSPYVGLIAALAVDLGLVGLAHGVGARRRAGAPTRDLWAGILFFVLVSTAANVDHGLSVAGGERASAQAWAALDAYEQARVLILSACLPLMVLFLARVIETQATGGCAGAQVADPSAQPGMPTTRRSLPSERKDAAVAIERPAPAGGALSATIVSLVARTPGVTVTEIARDLHRPRQTVSRHVAQLLARGTLQRSEAGGLVTQRAPT